MATLAPTEPTEPIGRVTGPCCPHRARGRVAERWVAPARGLPLQRASVAAVLVVTLAISLILPLRAARATTIGPDAFDYTATDSVPFAFEDITSTGTRVLVGADDGTDSEPLGFTFPFYGQSFTTVSFSSNGLITFLNPESQFENTDLSTDFFPTEPSIAVFWDDLQFFQAGADAVYFETAGSAPNRRFVVQWNNVGHYFSSPKLITFEAILFEGGSILLQYQNVDTGDENAFGASATVGIRDSGGETNGRYLQWSFDSAVLSNGSVLSFTTSCGDGVIDAGEGCDDGNTTSGDGCSAGCQVEPCYSCSGAPSTCSPQPDGTACDDGLFCNGTDTCAGASCSVHSGVDPCTGGAECNNVCNEATKNCTAPNGTPCADDGNACTFDECDGAGTCGHPNADGTPCDDGLFCNGPDQCFLGSCQFHSGDPCVGQECVTTCDELAGQCDPQPAGQPCTDDGLACTADQCDGEGSCAHPPLAVGAPCPDDGNVCTMDECDGIGLCVHPPLAAGAPCADDGNACTIDECNGTGLCVHPAQPDGTACDDANSCTQTDRCASGQCVGTDPIVCAPTLACHEPGTCDASTGTCTACPAGYMQGQGGCEKSYAIDVLSLTNQAQFCDGTGANRYTCAGPFGFQWTDAGDASVGEVERVDVELEAGLDCSGVEHEVSLNGTSIGIYATTAAATCECEPEVVAQDLADVDASTYVKGGTNAVAITTPACTGLSADAQGHYARVTVTYAAADAPLLIRTDCRAAGKTKFRYQNRANDDRDRVQWKWLRGAATTQAEFADPTTSAEYQFCVFAETSESPALLMSADVPHTASLWHSLGHLGYAYSDKAGGHDGMRQILVKAGAAGHSKIILEGKGAALSDPVLPAAPVQGLRFQLSNQATGVCWESELPASAIVGGIGGHSP